MAIGPKLSGKKRDERKPTAHDLHGKPRRNSDLNIKAKLGIVSVLAAALIGFAVLGLGQSTQVRADVTAGNVYILPQHSTTPVNAAQQTAGIGSCANGGGSQVNTTNFPPSTVSFFLNTGTTSANPIGLPLVEINALSAASSVLNTTNPTFVSQSFIFICVNTTSTSAGTIGGTVGGTVATAGGAPVGFIGDGPLTFSAIVQANMGFFDQPGCGDKNANRVLAEWSNAGGSDNCIIPSGAGIAGGISVGTAELEIPDDITNDVSTVIVRFNCSLLSPGFTTGPVMPARRFRPPRTRSKSSLPAATPRTR